ncbi:DUF1643 domain-containing protein [Jeotgalibacillus sp. ET6]|uniref:DUF1643 domain-containing protein n=1 Tax=Jeotgalibacillus sp. ET6 TaxID=3037260 RepID=UPI002418B60E|nr:DUF1643 domain-containing protein [Jeotgalibacillus sp. ET6]MDG5470531.1 DUF1643 domain-containing protein [Jeotgalibacillus sp. ET6]
MPNRPWKNDELVEVFFDTEDTSKRKYRYLLKCTWNDQSNRVTFVMLNPSVADLDTCDPTLDRCSMYARSWGYGGFSVVNLFALIAKNPEDLKLEADPIGPENDSFIIQSIEESDKVIFAWGEKDCKILNRNKQIITMLKDYQPYCIKKTKHGNHPRHPLYLKSELTPIIY